MKKKPAFSAKNALNTDKISICLKKISIFEEKWWIDQIRSIGGEMTLPFLGSIYDFILPENFFG